MRVCSGWAIFCPRIRSTLRQTAFFRKISAQNPVWSTPPIRRRQLRHCIPGKCADGEQLVRHRIFLRIIPAGKRQIQGSSSDRGNGRKTAHTEWQTLQPRGMWGTLLSCAGILGGVTVFDCLKADMPRESSAFRPPCLNSPRRGLCRAHMAN